MAGAPDHGLARKSVPGVHVEDAQLVEGEFPDEGEAVDGAILVDGHCVDKGGEGQAIAQGESDHTRARQQRLRSHVHLRDLCHAKNNHKTSENIRSTTAQWCKYKGI